MHNSSKVWVRSLRWSKNNLENWKISFKVGWNWQISFGRCCNQFIWAYSPQFESPWFQTQLQNSFFNVFFCTLKSMAGKDILFSGHCFQGKTETLPILVAYLIFLHVCQKCFFTTREEKYRPLIWEVFLFYPENDGQKTKYLFQPSISGYRKKH